MELIDLVKGFLIVDLSFLCEIIGGIIFASQEIVGEGKM